MVIDLHGDARLTFSYCLGGFDPSLNPPGLSVGDLLAAQQNVALLHDSITCDKPPT
jgi:hypothetical protein